MVGIPQERAIPYASYHNGGTWPSRKACTLALTSASAARLTGMRPTSDPRRPGRATRLIALVLAVGLAVGLAGCATGSTSTPLPTPTPVVVVLATEPREQTADQQVEHVLNRLGFGARPGDVARVRAVGVDQWIGLQLAPDRI